MDNKYVENSLKKLLHWIDVYGYMTYDPYDIKGYSNFTLKCMNPLNTLSFPEKATRYLLLEIFDQYFPLLLRKLFGIEKKIHATAQGTLLLTYLNLYQVNKNSTALSKAKELQKWLLSNSIKGYSGYCWGTPFRWKSGELIYEVNTPFTVVTAWVGDAFYKAYKLTNDKKDLEVCKSICNFLLHDIPHEEMAGEKICFSYSPLKQDYIHNANLFAGEFLLRIGTEINDKTFISYGIKAINYSVSEQKPTGSIPYYGTKAKMPDFNDLYHSGYEIRMLYSAWKLTNKNNLFKATEKYLSFFISNYFHKSGAILTQPKRKYPKDITAAAEAILTLSSLKNDFSVDEVLYNRTIKWIIDNMQTKQGWFIYRINKPGIKIKIPYIRWGQSWMALALSNHLVVHKTNQ